MSDQMGDHATVEAERVATRARPLPASWTVERARDAYLEENGFKLAAYDAPRTEAAFAKIRFSVPNTPHHRWGIMLHDLHHVATGYGTNPAGEGEISAWELRRGIRPLGFYVGTIVVLGTLMGLLVAPIRTVRACRRAGESRGSLFHLDMAYEELLKLTVGQLRERLGIARTGLAGEARRLHSLAPDPATRP